MKRQASPQISSSGAYALAHYEQTLREREDLTPASVRYYWSDVRHFIVWFEAREFEHAANTQIGNGFDPQRITTPTLTRYRTSLQADGRQKPASVNRALIGLKRSFGWASEHQLIANYPSTAVKLIGQRVLLVIWMIKKNRSWSLPLREAEVWYPVPIRQDERCVVRTCPGLHRQKICAGEPNSPM